MPRLSKSKFLSGNQCVKRLWFEVHRHDLIPPVDPAQQRIFDQGHEVGELAQGQFPGGKLITADHVHIPDALANTQKALSTGESILYEPAFEFDNVLVRVDILERLNNDGWHLVEVKSSTTIKPENIQDVAIQAYVLKGSGLDIDRVSLMHINRESVYPDLSNLFTLVALTDEATNQMPAIHSRIDTYRRMLAESTEPDVGIGTHCSSPYGCPFIEHCWEGVPILSVYTIPRLNEAKRAQLVTAGHVELAEIPESTDLTPTQRKYLEFHRDQRIEIDWESIRSELDGLTYPLYFLDFETDNPAIPRFDGQRPYVQFPFQYSCHILHEDGSLEHREYLHVTNDDPRPALAASLVDAIGEIGHVVAYNASFEKDVILGLAEHFPQYRKSLEAITRRLWDQLVIFRKYYKDYRFNGSNGLKSVLPVIVPEMSYDGMEVSHGQEAQVVWNDMIRMESGPERLKLQQGLLEYCRQDTLAMVRIHQKLMDVPVQTLVDI